MTKPLKEGTSGYYLRELRKMYGLSQPKISNDIVNRSKVAHIELNDKNTILTESDCKAIANTIIKVVGNELKQDKEFLYLYFYNHEKYLAAEKAQEIFKVIKSDFDNNKYNDFNKNFKLFDSIFIKYDLPEIKVKSFLLKAKFLRIKNNLEEAYLYAYRALDNALLTENIDSQIDANIILGQYLYYMERYNECIDVCTGILKKYNNLINNSFNAQIYYNMAHSYRKIDEYDLALNNFKTLKKYIKLDNMYQYSDVQNSIALCLFKQSLHDEAIKILLDLLDNLNGKYIIQQANTYDNLIIILKDKNDIENIQLYANKLRLILPQINVSENINNNVNHASQLYFNLAETYDLLGEFDFAESFYNKSIELSKLKNNTDLQYKCLLNLFDLYMKYDRKTRINLLVTNLCEALTNITIKADNRFMLKILNNFIKCGQFDECSNIINLLLER